jgi:hypothetical protein
MERRTEGGTGSIITTVARMRSLVRQPRRIFSTAAGMGRSRRQAGVSRPGSMFLRLRHDADASLVEVLNLAQLHDPFQPAVLARLHGGEELQEPEPFAKQELLFVVIGGIFVLENVSVILQVGSYKLRKKRIFKMAPLHHHFEKNGLSESTIVIRFWIVAVILALVGLASLKVR